MNNRELNKEFIQKRHKTPDSDDGGASTSRSLTRSSLSARSSLLSARSPRDDFQSFRKPNTTSGSRKHSPYEEENDFRRRNHYEKSSRSPKNRSELSDLSEHDKYKSSRRKSDRSHSPTDDHRDTKNVKNYPFGSTLRKPLNTQTIDDMLSSKRTINLN
jgi:hypothetical protein